MHSLTEFLFKYPEESKNWYNNSNSIVFLQATLQELEELILKCKSKNIKYSEFYEPDLNNELTSVCLEPGNKTKKLCYHFKLALKGE
jgi:hypothetical protein